MLSVDEGIMRCEGKEKMKPKRKEIASRSRAISLLCEGCNTARTTTRKPLYFISPQLRLLPGTATVTAAMTDTNLCGLDLLIIADLAPSLSGSALPRQSCRFSLAGGCRRHELRQTPGWLLSNISLAQLPQFAVLAAKANFSFAHHFLNQLLGLIHRWRLPCFLHRQTVQTSLADDSMLISHGQHGNGRSWQQARSIWLIH